MSSPSKYTPRMQGVRQRKPPENRPVFAHFWLRAGRETGGSMRASARGGGSGAKWRAKERVAAECPSGQAPYRASASSAISADELGVGAPGLPRRHGKLRLRRQPGIRIGLDDRDAAVGPEAHVDTGVVAQFERLEHRDRRLLQRGDGLVGQPLGDRRLGVAVGAPSPSPT